MADKFDPYRESLVVECTTLWPEDYEVDPHRRLQLEAQLHESPAEAAQLEYVRTHTGFCRQIVVTQDDLERIS
jgi:hypothetical protein